MALVAFRKVEADRALTVEIVIDGRPLLDLVRDVEAESAARDGQPELAGKYGNLPWEIVATRLLLGEATGIWGALESGQRGHRVPLLECECGEPGCWPLMATIEVTADHVTWSDFRQPHREKWDYSKLGPFLFDRAQYVGALEDARSDR